MYSTSMAGLEVRTKARLLGPGDGMPLQVGGSALFTSSESAELPRYEDVPKKAVRRGTQVRQVSRKSYFAHPPVRLMYALMCADP